MNLAALISGGKDSLYATYRAQQAGHKITHLITFVSENPESYMFHTANIHLVDTIANLTGLPLVKIPTKGEKEKELDDIKKALAELPVDGITTGAIASVYQKSRIDNICNDLGLASIAPLWGQDPEHVLRDMLNDGFVVMIVAVAAPPLDAGWLGRTIDERCIDELVQLNRKYGIHPLGEGGEYDSLVLDCPLYSKRLIIDDAEKQWDEKTQSGVLSIRQAHTEKRSF